MSNGIARTSDAAMVYADWVWAARRRRIRARQRMRRIWLAYFHDKANTEAEAIWPAPLGIKIRVLGAEHRGNPPSWLPSELPSRVR